MVSTYLSLHYHLASASKNGETALAPEWRSRMFDYLGGIISGLGPWRCDPSRIVGLVGSRPGGIASLNHRLMAVTPPA
ncbi:MAG: hypothetical protein ACJ8FY_10550 [Gemmataceae bacterium]